MSQQPTPHYTESAAQRLDASAIRALVPPLVAEWIDLMGVLPTLALVRAYPGVQMKVPLGTKPGVMSRRLVALLGAPAAELFMFRHGGEHLTVPSCAGMARALRDAEIVAAYERGEKLHDIALATRLTLRQLRYILKMPGGVAPSGPAVMRAGRMGDGNPNQLDLLGEPEAQP